MARGTGRGAVQDYRLSFTGYDKPDVERAARDLARRSKAHGVEVTGGQVCTSWKLVRGHPRLWGCDDGEETTRVLPVRGALADLKALIRTDTPDGVYMSLLPGAR